MASGTGRITPADVPQDVLRGKPLLEGFVEKQERSFLKRYARRYFVLFGGSAPLLCYFGNRDQPNDLRGAFDLRRLRAVEAQGAELVLVIGEVIGYVIARHIRERFRQQLLPKATQGSNKVFEVGQFLDVTAARDKTQSRECRKHVQTGMLP